MALAVVRSGNGDCDQITCLLRVVHLTFYMYNETASGRDLELIVRPQVPFQR